jgi:hemolysin III
MTAYEALELSAHVIRTRLQRWEMRVDGAIHGVAIVAALIGAVVLLLFTRHRGDAEDVAAVAIYATGLLAMFGCSCAYNLGRFSRHCDWLRALDQTAILLMIAGTYTPFTVINLHGPWSWSFTSAIWSLALVGALLRLLWWRLFARLSIGIYLALGWLGVAAI